MPSPTPIEVQRHYTELSAKKTNEVVDAVASLIVAYFMADGQTGREVSPGPTGPHDQVERQEV